MYYTIKFLTVALMATACNAALAVHDVSWYKHYDYSNYTFTSECHDGPQMDFPLGDLTTHFCPHDDPAMDDPTMFITHNEGRSFSFLSFDLLAGQALIRSSKGGGFLRAEWPDFFDGNLLYLDLSQNAIFNDVMWVSILAYDGHDHGSVSLLNLQLWENTCEDPNAPGCPKSVSEPPTWALLMLPVLALAFRWRFKQQFWRALKP